LIQTAVIEAQISLAALGIVVAVLFYWSGDAFRPLGIEPRKAELVVPAPGSILSLPAGWTVTGEPGKAAAIHRDEPIWLKLVVPVSIAAAAVCAFLFPLSPPFWALLVLLCGVWGYGIYGNPVEQSVSVAADGSLTLHGSARLAWIAQRTESVPAKAVETVLLHKDRPEVYIVFTRDQTRVGWRVYADSVADAQALAALALRQLAKK
jgi:hypothetical protein